RPRVRPLRPGPAPRESPPGKNPPPPPRHPADRSSAPGRRKSPEPARPCRKCRRRPRRPGPPRPQQCPRNGRLAALDFALHAGGHQLLVGQQGLQKLEVSTIARHHLSLIQGGPGPGDDIVREPGSQTHHRQAPPTWATARVRLPLFRLVRTSIVPPAFKAAASATLTTPTSRITCGEGVGTDTLCNSSLVNHMNSTP